VANADHRFLVAEQCRSLGVDPLGILLEPVARNTASAIASAAFAALHKAKEDPVLLVLPSDHTFADIDTFQEALKVGLSPAQQGSLVTFGITPTHAETGYGYRQPLSAAW
jgi:mannose-1-phosphate guanylyltransferase/mannose-1-phosphate guanylyltransferase/mannose-6-phosphate isomerase